MTRLLPAAGRPAQRWKNGGGVTSTVASHPPGAGLDDFAWRISIAEVAAAGPFSAFPGIDRHLSVLSGTLRLTFADRVVMLAAGEPGLAFPGDVPVSGAPTDGAVTDCNVMTRRGQASATVIRADAGTATRPDGATLVLLALAPATLTVGARRHRLAARDALLIDSARAVTHDGPCIVVTLLCAKPQSIVRKSGNRFFANDDATTGN